MVVNDEEWLAYCTNRFQSFDPVGTYAASVVLALLAVATLLVMSLFRNRDAEE